MTSVSGVDNILSQIRAMRQSTPGVGSAPTPGINTVDPSQGAVKPAGFGDMLKAGIDNVNSVQKAAAANTAAYERGDSEMSLTQVMVSLQKSDVSFKAATEVRNKMIDAYHEIMRMSV
ncbi:flagellar hook-basal body complex protein FliE [Paraperlucidibaca baekdonensis]|uniref:Flagellar hook-basal body complex protein FliE n=1 Tax=Paraperlucidibaca baekdonensis TaxID=748120 RepID=A0A3E0H3G6_9GAMM|nr:flagellar hook-basal body complex protein FliE [Paraperlucidibaca baekdonensis]REH36757.1 flagellar hook-basal body complex protein FliE [Paraperlucidibaca baekdonensis]